MPADRMSVFAGLVWVASALAGLPSLAVGEEQAAPAMAPYVQRAAEGWIDWQNGLIYGVGEASLRQNQGSKIQAMRAAQALARANILKLAGRIQLDDFHRIESYDQGRLARVLSAVVRDSEHASEFVDQSPDPRYKVTRVAPIKGVEGLTSGLLPHLESLAGPGPLASPSSSADDAEGPWLVLDARRLKGSAAVKPALFPKIVSSSGEVLYRPDGVERAALQQRGMAEYVVADPSSTPVPGTGPQSAAPVWLWRALGIGDADADEPARPRSRRREYVVKGVEAAQGLEKTNLVVSDQDARAIKDAGASGQILKKCRVVVIVSSPMGGVEGRLGSPSLLASRTR